MRSIIVVAGFLIALFAILGVAFAGQLATEVPELDAAITARVQQIGADPSGKSEAKRLTKAQKKLSTFTGTNIKKDLAVLGQAAKQLYKSGTSDATILAEAADVLQCVCAVAMASQTTVNDLLATITDPKQRAQIANILAVADAFLADGKALEATDPAAAHKLFVKAWKKYEAAVKKANKFLSGPPVNGKCEAALPPGVSVPDNSFLFSNAHPSRHYFITDVLISGSIDDDSGNNLLTPSGLSLRAIAATLFDGAQNRVEFTSLHDLYRYIEPLRGHVGFPLVDLFLHGSLEFHLSSSNDAKCEYRYAFLTQPQGLGF